MDYIPSVRRYTRVRMGVILLAYAPYMGDKVERLWNMAVVVMGRRGLCVCDRLAYRTIWIWWFSSTAARGNLIRHQIWHAQLSKAQVV